jgi:hypothetical protein
MFGRLLEYIKILTDVLKSREIIKDDDLPAFRSAFHAADDIDPLLPVVRAEYQKIGKLLGLTVTTQENQELD